MSNHSSHTIASESFQRASRLFHAQYRKVPEDTTGSEDTSTQGNEEEINECLRSVFTHVQHEQTYEEFGDDTTLRELLDMFLENHCHTQFSISALKALNNCIIANADAQHVALSPDVNIWDNLLSILPEADKYGLRCIPKSPAIPAEDGTRDSVNELRRMARLIKLVTSSLGRLAGTNIEYAEKMWENPQYAELLSRLLGLCFEDLSQATDNTLLDPEVAIASNVFILFYNSLAKLGCSRACNCTGEENEGCVFKGKTNSMLDEACSHGASVYRMNPNFTSISSNSFKLVMYYDWFGNLPEPVMSQKSEHLMGLLSVLDNSQQEEEISHLLVVAHYIASKHVQAKCRLKQMCDIDGALQTKKPIKDMEWPLQLCTSRLQSLNSVSKRFAGEFIYELCDLQAEKYSSLTGMGRALPLLQAKGKVERNHQQEIPAEK